MNYHEIVQMVRDVYENSDAREIYEHIAIQVNITGEGEGAFYIEIADRQVCVEPYEYYDRDGLVITTADCILAIINGTSTFAEECANGRLRMEGNQDKLFKFSQVKLKKKKSVRKKTTK